MRLLTIIVAALALGAAGGYVAHRPASVSGEEEARANEYAQQLVQGANGSENWRLRIVSVDRIASNLWRVTTEHPKTGEGWCADINLSRFYYQATGGFAGFVVVPCSNDHYTPGAGAGNVPPSAVAR